MLSYENQIPCTVLFVFNFMHFVKSVLSIFVALIMSTCLLNMTHFDRLSCVCSVPVFCNNSISQFLEELFCSHLHQLRSPVSRSRTTARGQLLIASSEDDDKGSTY